MDVKSETDFNTFLENEYISKVDEYYSEIEKEIKTNLIVGFSVSFIFAIVFPFVFSPSTIMETIGNYYFLIVVAYYVLLSIAAIMTIKHACKKVLYRVNENIIKDILAFIINDESSSITYEPKKMLSTSALRENDLFNLDVVRYTGKNYICAKFNGDNMVFSDVNTYVYEYVESQKYIYKNGRQFIRTTRKRVKKDIFNGLFIGATGTKNNTEQLFLIPNNFNDSFLQSKLYKYIMYHGEEIMLENLDFSKRYKVFCDDQIQARNILSLTLMERINNLDELFKGKKYIVFRKGKRFSIFIEDLTIESIKKNNLPIFRDPVKERTVLNEIFNSLNDLFKVYRVLDLGNERYKK